MNPDIDPQFIIEIATSDFASTKSAVEGGADRIELCANLGEGGTTPSLGHIRQCREAFTIPIYPIIRPRGGDFLYTEEEFQIIRRDLLTVKELGCDGVVIGLLLADGSIDLKRTAALVDLAYPLGVTFHRAFDRCREPFEAMEQLIEIGCERILTSGQQPEAETGIELIRQLNEQAANRIIIMPGSGVRPSNIHSLATASGCVEFHSSLRGSSPSKMQFIHPGFAGSAESYTNNSIDPEEVRKLRAALSSIGIQP